MDPDFFFLRVFKKLNNRIRLKVLGAAPRNILLQEAGGQQTGGGHTCHAFLPPWVWEFIVAQFLVLAYLGCLVV